MLTSGKRNYITVACVTIVARLKLGYFVINCTGNGMELIEI